MNEGYKPYAEADFVDEQIALRNANELGYRDGIRAGVIVGLLTALCLVLAMNVGMKFF